MTPAVNAAGRAGVTCRTRGHHHDSGTRSYGGEAVRALGIAAERATGYVQGGISPLGQKKRLQTVPDALAAEFDAICVNGGRRGLEIEPRPADLLRLSAGRSAPISR